MLTGLLSLTSLKTAASQTPSAPLGLAESYNLTTNTLGIINAAAFGLTPNLFINVLKDRSNNLTSQLKSITPADQGNVGRQS